MITYRCPKCKYEIGSIKYCKIKSIICRGCKKEMIKLYEPTERILKNEMKLNMSFINKQTKNKQNTNIYKD